MSKYRVTVERFIPTPADKLFEIVATPAKGGTYVQEEWDASEAKHRRIMRLLGFPKRNRRGITRTLERLAELATAQ